MASRIRKTNLVGTGPSTRAYVFFTMTIRPAYPDELARAKSLLHDHPVPPEAGFLVGVIEQPVERLVASIPWWKVPLPGSERRALRFNLHYAGDGRPQALPQILEQLEDIARKNNLSALLTDFSLQEEHPLYLQLTALGCEVSQTDRFFSTPGETLKARSNRIFGRIKAKLPREWKTESIAGHNPQKLFDFVAAHSLMSPQQFHHHWDTANMEHFVADYSVVLTKGDELLGIFLVTRRGADELHIHVEAASAHYHSQSAFISTCLRHASFSRCPDGFPATFTWRADSKKHRQTGNTALRNGGIEEPPRHYLKKTIEVFWGQVLH